MSSDYRPYELLRATLLVYGLRPERRAAEILRSKYGAKAGFIHGIVIQLDNGAIVNTRALDLLTAVRGAPVLEYEVARDAFGVRWGGRSWPVAVMPAGSALAPSFDPSALESFSLHSPSALFCSPVDQCIFGVIGKPCSFCTYEMHGPIRRLEPVALRSSLDVIIRAHPRIETVAFGGGTPSLVDSGVRYNAELVRVARERVRDVSVELVPPPQLSDLSALDDAGATSVVMSLELWDEELRSQVCLGKGEIPRAHYFEAWDVALDLFGDGGVASVLLVGLEPPESTVEGARSLIGRGVIPTLIPYRRYETTVGSPDVFPVSPDEYLAMAEEIRSSLLAARLNPALRGGCTACGGCSMEIGSSFGSVSGVEFVRKV